MIALLLIDLQNDFLPGGALGVDDGDQVIPIANEMMARYQRVIATQDWHPQDHLSFASQHEGKQPGDVIELDGLQQVLWPDHCIQGTSGAMFAEELDETRIDQVIRKGTDRKLDSYSGFYDNARRYQTDLHATLAGFGVNELHIMGLATDYCVKFTALDAITLGYKVKLLANGCRGVEMNQGDCTAALNEIKTAGGVIA